MSSLSFGKKKSTIRNGSNSELCPYDRANLFSKYSIAYMLPLFRLSYKKKITLDDIGPPPRSDQSRLLGSQLEKVYNQELLNKQEPSLTRCLLKVFGPRLFFWCLLDICSKCIAFPLQTISLGWLIRDAGIYLNLASTSNSTATLQQTTAIPSDNLNTTSTTTTTTTTTTALAPPLALIAAELSADEAYWRIIYDAILLIGCTMLAVSLSHPFFFQTYHMGMQLRIAACRLVYKKALRLSQSAMCETTVGQMVNLLSNDVNRFDQVAQMMPYLLVAPLQATTVLLLLSLFYLGGYPTLAGLAAILLYVAIQTSMGRGFSKYRSKTARRTDERVRLMNEIILAMKIIKMYAWEEPFKKLVHAARKREITTIAIASILKAINQTLFFVSSKVIVFVALIIYLSLGNSLNPEVLFVTIGLANLVRISLTLFFPNAIAYVAETMVSCRRINTFLQLPEIQLSSANYKISPDTLGCKHVLAMSKIYASWAARDQDAIASSEARLAVLRNMSLVVKPRDLVLIVGRVGSGKSSVLMTLLGELPITSGRLEINGRISYASQEAWIFSGTVRDNILFGKPLDSDRYQRIIEVCSLRRDLEILVDGDQTLLGERGVSLSGGQKARVNLARALYQEADIYLLDDPLSAVDAPVARHIFNQSLKTFLRKKTVILATHQLQFLRHATKVLVVDRDSPAAFGTLQEVMQSEAFAVVDYSKEAFEDATTTTETGTEVEPGERRGRSGRGSTAARSLGSSSHGSPPKNAGDDGDGGGGGNGDGSQNEDGERLIRAHSQASSNLTESSKRLSLLELEQEKRAKRLEADDASAEQRALRKEKKCSGSSRRSGAEILSDIPSNFFTYFYYFKNASGPIMFVWFVLINVLAQTLYQFTDFYLSYWTDSLQRKEYQGANFVPVSYADSLDMGQMSAIYAALIGILFVVTLLRTGTFFASTLRASVNIHRKLFEGIIHAPMPFFDFSPIGILLNRLSRDIGFVDETLPATAIEIVTIFVNILGIIVLSIILNINNLFAALLLFVAAFSVRSIGARTVTRLKQIEGLTRSPIYSHLSTTLAGLCTIRAFRVQDEFVRLFDRQQDTHSSVWFNYLSAGRWLTVTLDWLCLSFIALVVALLLAFSLDATNASLVGLLISQVVIIPGPFQWGMRQLIEVESQMTSVQRIKEFSELQSEAQLMSAVAHEPGSASGSSSSRATDDYQPLASYQSGRLATPAGSTPDEEGELRFIDLSLSYFPDEPPVLKRLNFTIKPREKVGIVGRTGAGKSSIVSVLFRLYDFDGRVQIDGRDTKQMSLNELRRSMSIIPQDPILFGATIRKNLDPFGDYSDAQLWEALEGVDLRAVFARTAQGLEYLISEGGANFSVGQRQLICLARAILRKNKILLLDEATANVDPQTDQFIQRTIVRQFAQCTVLTIAHRLVTIVDSDRVLVLDRGEVSEFGTPHELLQNEQGIFAQMVASSGQQAPRLRRLIEDARARRQTD